MILDATNTNSNKITSKIMEEDFWLRSDNGVLIRAFMQEPDLSFHKKVTIEIAELDTVNSIYKDSAGLHCTLGELYKTSLDELSSDYKKRIEVLKLRKTQREYILNYKDKSSDEITALLPHKGVDLEEVIKAASDCTDLRRIEEYIEYNNLTRARYHINKSLVLSKNNPTVFRNLIKPTAEAYLPVKDDEQISSMPNPRYANRDYPYAAVFRKNFEDAKNRFCK